MKKYYLVIAFLLTTVFICAQTLMPCSPDTPLGAKCYIVIDGYKIVEVEMQKSSAQIKSVQTPNAQKSSSVRNNYQEDKTPSYKQPFTTNTKNKMKSKIAPYISINGGMALKTNAKADSMEVNDSSVSQFGGAVGLSVPVVSQRSNLRLELSYINREEAISSKANNDKTGLKMESVMLNLIGEYYTERGIGLFAGGGFGLTKAKLNATSTVYSGFCWHTPVYNGTSYTICNSRAFSHEENISESESNNDTWAAYAGVSFPCPIAQYKDNIFFDVGFSYYYVDIKEWEMTANSFTWFAGLRFVL
jgi:opacity protein-like surface antigen